MEPQRFTKVFTRIARINTNYTHYTQHTQPLDPSTPLGVSLRSKHDFCPVLRFTFYFFRPKSYDNYTSKLTNTMT